LVIDQKVIKKITQNWHPKN